MGMDGSRPREHPPGVREVETSQPTTLVPSSSPPEQPGANRGRPQEQQVFQPHTLEELIQKRIGKARLLDPLTLTTKIYESLFSKEIQEREFSKKFSTLTFDYYSE